MNLQSPISILSVPVHNVTFAETIAIIESFIQEKMPRQICTVNPEFVMAAQKDKEFRSILQNADLCLPDGIGILWAATWLKSPLRERVTGSDLLPLIAREAAGRGWALFFLGAAAGVADRAAQILRERHPHLKIVGTHTGSPHPADDDESTRLIRQAQPDILFVAYGAPAQDKWIQRNKARVGVPVMMGVGGSFDFISGAAARAPRWIQSVGFEWLHRLIRQPWRWKRMLALPRFVVKVIRDK
jgi:N-acetylglucosaminyldiphosphoundecaprenol N-acetyl-beta-D-mannosaminyltransferase